MNESWLKTKWINARTKEGEPQTEALQYGRKLFEEFGTQDTRFSGAAIVGSTMKGYGHADKSDLDVALFYCDKEKQGSFIRTDFIKFLIEFKAKREKENKKNFEIELISEINLAKLASNSSLLDYASTFYQLSFPIIETKNPNAVMPIKEALDKLKEIIVKLTDEQKERLVDYTFRTGRHYIKAGFYKYSLRRNQASSDPVNEEEYVEAKLKMLKHELKSKFGLVVESEV